jgi:hypothetical protein
MSMLATSAVVVVGPWALLVVLVLIVLLIPVLVRLVLEKGVPARDRDVSVRVRLFIWLRIEIDVKPPGQQALESKGCQVVEECADHGAGCAVGGEFVHEQRGRLVELDDGGRQ